MAAKMRIGAVVLAAGQSKRMGQPKMVLQWGERTVIEQVVAVLMEAQVAEIVVVTGGAHEQVEEALTGCPVQTVLNPQFDHSEMLVSLQYGLRAIEKTDCPALLVVLGDQPEISAETVSAVMDAFQRSQSSLVVPSYRNRRGHPWLVARRLWDEIFDMPPEKNMRDFLNAHVSDIEYVLVDIPEILKDLDTPEDYSRFKPGPKLR